MTDPFETTAAEVRRKMAGDPHRPTYHFLPPANWMNDPNGTIFWKGQYHLFYQYNPSGAFHGTIHWAHAVSEDLVHWTDLPIALAPAPDGPDSKGCFSGHAFDDDGVPTLIYYGNSGGNCLATSDDDMLVWTKCPDNPVIPHPPAGQEEYRPFDPCAWKEGDTWYSLSGGSMGGIGDTAFLFRSPDLIHWEYMHPFYVNDTEAEHESDCAVPNFFPLGDKHVLLFSSHKRGSQYYIGTYADHRFHPEIHGRLSFGGFCAGGVDASITWADDAGRRILIGWMAEGRNDQAQREAGWAGVMTLPWILSLGDGGTMRMNPAPELEVLRGDHRRFDDVTIGPETPARLEGIRGDCLEIDARFEPGDAETFGVTVRCSEDGREQTVVSWNRADKQLSLDAQQSTLSDDVEHAGAERATFELTEGEELRLRIFLDRSIVEVFANGRLALTKRIYPALGDSLGVGLFASGGSAVLRLMDVWQMKPIWPA